MEQASTAEIGYGLAKRYWNKGLTTELATALLQWRFQTKCLEQVMEKLGMQDCGVVDCYGLPRKYYRILQKTLESKHQPFQA